MARLKKRMMKSLDRNERGHQLYEQARAVHILGSEISTGTAKT